MFSFTEHCRNIQDQISHLQHIIQLLPLINRDTLYVLLQFLGLVAENAEDKIDESGEKGRQCSKIPHKKCILEVALFISKAKITGVYFWNFSKRCDFSLWGNRTTTHAHNLWIFRALLGDIVFCIFFWKSFVYWRKKCLRNVNLNLYGNMQTTHYTKISVFNTSLSQFLVYYPV